jgi:HK97 family phage major capsid protein
MHELEVKLAAVHGEMKTWIDKAADEQKARGKVDEQTQTTLAAFQKQLDAIDAKMVERLTATNNEIKSLTETLSENEDVARLIRNKKGRVNFTLTGAHAQSCAEQKTTISGLSTITPNVVDAERRPGIVLEARRKLVVRDVLAKRPTASPLVYWVKVNSPLAIASPQVEGASKAENAVTFTTANSPVKLIATFMRASQQALQDFGELAGFLESSLPYYVNKAEEIELLSGDNTGEHLNGLITQATTFNTALLSAAAGYTRIDQIGAAIEQIGSADEIEPSFVLLNTRDLWRIRRTKDSYGRYILGDPQTVGNPTIWDLMMVGSNSVPAGTFVVGSGDANAAEIRDRMEMQVDISTEDADNFTKNLVTIRAEKRMVLTVLRPASFITGTFATSPATLA